MFLKRMLHHRHVDTLWRSASGCAFLTDGGEDASTINPTVLLCRRLRKQRGASLPSSIGNPALLGLLDLNIKLKIG